MNSQHTFPFLTYFNTVNYGHIIKSHITLLSLALRIFEPFVRILLIVNLYLFQTLLTFLLYVRQTLMTQLILAISLGGFTFL